MLQERAQGDVDKSNFSKRSAQQESQGLCSPCRPFIQLCVAVFSTLALCHEDYEQITWSMLIRTLKEWWSLGLHF